MMAEHAMQEDDIKVTEEMIDAGRVWLIGFNPDYESAIRRVACNLPSYGDGKAL
jgi:hypothetical protein